MKKTAQRKDRYIHCNLQIQCKAFENKSLAFADAWLHEDKIHIESVNTVHTYIGKHC